MVFELLIGNQEHTTKWYYDTDGSTLKDSHNKEIENPLLNVSKKTKSIRRLTISMGFSCNMKCSYCLQSKTKKEAFDILKSDLIIKKLVEEDLTNTRIEFWGGEPLLYLKEIKYITHTLKMNNKKPLSYLLITNGLGLNKKLAEWLMDNNFNIAISHDAQSQDIRGIEPFNNDDVKEGVLYLLNNFNNRFSINSVLSKNNLNTEDRIGYFKKILDFSGNINHSGEGPIYNTDININDFKQMSIDIYNDLLLGKGIDYGFYKNALDSFFKSIESKKKINSITTKCGVDSENNYKILSLDDKKLTCHNYNTNLPLFKFTDRKKCTECIVAHMCKGSCPIIKKDSVEFDKNCETMYSTYISIFRIAIFLLSKNTMELLDYRTVE